MSSGKKKQVVAKKTGKTTIRKAVKQDSMLQARIVNGLGAMKKAHKKLVVSTLHKEFDDSLDIDEAFRKGHEEENRWDYLLGHKSANKLIALEPHSANDGEVSTVINKRTAALDQLREHLSAGRNVAAWLWVASSTVDFARTEKTVIRLADNGITFVGKMVREKHIK